MLSALFALTVAGEKMPWLNVHIALPLALLAGRSLGSLIAGLEARVELPPLRRWAPLALATLSTALAAGVFVLAGAESGPAVAGWLLIVAALLTIVWSGRSFSPQAALRIGGTALAAALLVFTVRASVLSSWGHPDLLKDANTLASRDRGDTPVEMLDYVQSSPDIPVVRDAIDKVAAVSGEGVNLPIVIDATDDFSWPWAWYLRKYENLTIQNIDKDYTPPPGSVVLAKWQDNSYLKIDPTLFTEGTRYHHRWWFPVDYQGLSSQQVVREMFDASAWEKWGRYLADRSLPEGLPALDAVVYFPRDPRYSEVLSATLHKKSQ
jgi:predicted membrane-bound mannosyltransferase